MTPSARMAGILDRERPETVELAEAISLASLIEPRLIRAMRLGLFRRFHTAVEADLWFSRFVHSRAVDGVVLDPELAGELRLRLRDSGRLDASWEIVKRIHTNTSPAVRIEEEVAWLSTRGDPESIDRIRGHLRNALAGLVAGDRQGLGMWALRALPRMSPVVWDLEETRMLHAAARARLTGELKEIENTPEWKWLLPSVVSRTVKVAVRLFEGAVELGPRRNDTEALIDVPETKPLVIKVESGGNAETIRFETGETRRLRVSRGTVRIHTADGVVHEVEANPGLDYSSFRRAHEQYFDVQGVLATVGKAVFERIGSRVFLTSRPGMGKTATLALLAGREPEGSPVLVAQHFFSASSHTWRDPSVAITSLCMQIERARPEWRIPEVFGIARLRYLLEGYPYAVQIVVLVDALDEMDEGPVADSLVEVLTGTISPRISVLLSARQGSSAAGQVMERSDVQVFDIDRMLAGSTGLMRRILQDAGPGVEVDRLLTRAEGSPLQAWIALAVYRADPSTALQGFEAIEAAWYALTREGRPQVIVGVVAFVCAMREPVSREWVEQVMGQPIPGPIERTSLWLLIEDQGLLKPRHESIRSFILNHQGTDRLQPHATILEHLSKWPLLEPLDPFLREYALRYGFYHLRQQTPAATPSIRRVGSPSGNERIEGRLADVGYIERMLRDLGSEETEKILEQALVGVNANAVGHIILAVLRANQAMLRRDPAQIRGLVYRQMVELRYADKVLDLVHFSEGVPELRPRTLAHELRHGEGPHRRAIRGCHLLDSTDVLAWSEDGCLRSWNRRDGASERLADLPASIEHCIPMEETHYVAGLSDGSVRLVIAPTRPPAEIVHVGLPHGGPIRGLLRLDPDRFVSWSADSRIRLWSLQSGQLGEFIGHTDEVLDCIVTEDWRWLVSAGADHSIRIWDIESRSVRQVIEGHKGAVNRVAFFREDQILSASDDTTLKLWDLETGAAIRSFNGHALAVTNCSVSSEGLILSASLDRTARLWSGDSGEVQATFSGHYGAVYQCEFIGTSGVVTCSADRTVKTWTRDGNIARTFYGHRAAVRRFVLTEETPQAIVSCSDDGTLRQWLPDTSPQEPQP